MRSGLRLFLALLIFPLAGGCTASVLGGSAEPQQSLAQINYAAADMLIQQSKSLVTADTPLQAGSLTDLDHPGETTAFGSMVAQQVGARFVQLGYNVSENGGAAPGGAMYDPAPAYGNATAGTRNMAASGPVEISGQYAQGKKTVIVNLRLTEQQTGRVLAAYDYNVPLTSDVRQLAKTSAAKNSFFGF